MTVKEFREKKAELRSAIAGLQGEEHAAERAAKEQELKELRESFQEETAVLERESIKKPEVNWSEKFREFIREAKPGAKFEMPMKREAMATTDTTPYVQGVSVVDLIKTERPDTDIFAAAGINITTGVVGNKIQWAYSGGVEAVFANELAQTTERKVDLDAQNPVQQRLTVRVRVSNQVLENSDFDLQALFTQAVRDSIRRKVNWAATSTAKATEVFYGGFAQDTESGTYGQAGYVPGKQVGTYETLNRQVFVDAIKKLAVRNIPIENCVFVLGAEDYWDAKNTPIDEGSGIMLLGNDNRILGVPVICNNAINRSTEKGAVSGHAIGLGNFAGMPVMQHGKIRLSVDSSSAVAADTDEVIITINADFSMTILKSMADGFVVMSKSGEPVAPTISGDTAIAAPKTAGNAKRTYSVSDGSAISAAVEEGKSWLTATVGSGNKVTFAWQANDGEAAPEREAEVTLATANGGELVVTVTQAANA